MQKLEAKIAVVTGGSSGIGRATARRFVDEGAYVFIIGRRQAELDAAKAEIGRNVSTIQADITDLDALDRVFAHIKAEKGALDIVVTSAGLVEHQPLAAATQEHFDKAFNLNARAVYFTVAKALPLLNDGATVVLVSSGAHQRGFEAHGTYAATKAAVRSFARIWANELKGRGIRVNALSPGAIDTPMIDGQAPTREAADGVRQMYASITPMGRIGNPDEMAKAVLFLASDDSSYTTGIDLAADGGFTQI
jgi:NAD(P)-dependent dehydrogenase (short-subunit alcohol dehydrogenase family)